MTISEVDELNARTDLFADPARTEIENQGPYLLVVDNFYPDPMRIRTLALAQRFVQYLPPLAEQVGVKRAAEFDPDTAPWFTTCLFHFRGKPVKHPIEGFRHADREVQESLANLVCESIDTSTWDKLGDGWNGAFHLQYASKINGRGIHHHYKDSDVCPRGWSGVVYLTPGEYPDSGTTIWRELGTGRCVAKKGPLFVDDVDGFEKIMTIENKFNRLVLFRENVLHRVEPGFGDGPDNGRLTQTFFFLTEAANSYSSG